MPSQPRLSALIADDEPLARLRLRTLLEGEGVEVLAEAGNGQEALELLLREQPDLALLDIRMPGLDGLALAQQVNGWPEPPALIFTTAHPEHAIAAIKAHAVDYLLKPIHAEDLRAALEAVQRWRQRLTPAPRATEEAEPRIPCSLGSREEWLPLSEVIALYSESRSTIVRHQGGQMLTQLTLRELMERHPGW